MTQEQSTASSSTADEAEATPPTEEELAEQRAAVEQREAEAAAEQADPAEGEPAEQTEQGEPREDDTEEGDDPAATASIDEADGPIAAETDSEGEEVVPKDPGYTHVFGAIDADDEEAVKVQRAQAPEAWRQAAEGAGFVVTGEPEVKVEDGVISATGPVTRA